MFENYKEKMGKYENIYLYGNGTFTEIVKKVFGMCGIEYKGMVVSDGYNNNGELVLSDIKSDRDKTCFIITTGSKSYTDIVHNICILGYYNLYFFSEYEKQSLKYLFENPEKLEEEYEAVNEQFNADGGSEAYWENRYKTDGGSGAGSYNKLAEFKARILNNFISAHPDIKICYEWGCGDGNQLSYINYPFYVGMDVSGTALMMCKEKFADDKTKKFYLADEMLGYVSENGKCDLAVSLDVLFNLTEDNVYEIYMDRLMTSTNKYVCIYSSNFERPQNQHERRRKFSDYIEKNFPEFELIEEIQNEYPYDFTKPNETSLSHFFFYKKIC